MDMISLAIWYEHEKRREAEKRKKHQKRNKAIEMCKRLKLHWKANDNKIKIIEWNETFTHSQTDELIRRLNSLEPFYL